VRIESDAQKDLALSDEDAENVAGGKETRKKSAKHTAAVAPLDPLTIKQIDTGPTEVSVNSGDADRVPDPSDPYPSS
jgi:hypothetical protein